MESLRRYLSIEELQNYGVTGSIDVYALISAESDIDNVIASFYQNSYCKCFLGYKLLENVELTSTTAILPITESQKEGFYKYTVLEILETGQRIAIKNNDNNILNFFDNQIGLTGTFDCKIFQYGKLPMVKDYEEVTTKIYKTLPDWLKDCVALQYKFRVANPTLFSGVGKQMTSYSVSSASYSESYGTGDNSQLTIKDLVDPKVYQILDSLGLTTQTI